MGTPSSPISPLISPTKARRDAAQAKDWAHVSSWLAKKYSPQPVPRFERNGETLRALLDLVAVNEVADREVELLQQAEEEELRRYEDAQRKDGGACRKMLAELENDLDERGRKALKDMAESNLLLGTLSPAPMVMGKRIIELSRNKLEMDEQLRRIDDLRSQLDREMQTMRTNIKETQSQEDDVAQEEMQERTAQLNRETKQFITKAGQYSERIVALEKSVIDSPDIQVVKEQEENVEKLQAQVRRLNKQVAELHDLPPDLMAAREEYQRAQKESQKLTRRREELFRAMLDE